MGAQVNIDEDGGGGGNGSADESLSGGRSNEYEPADSDRVRERDSSSPASQNFGETDKEPVVMDPPQPPMVSSCQTCLVQQPIQALMGVH